MHSSSLPPLSSGSDVVSFWVESFCFGECSNFDYSGECLYIHEGGGLRLIIRRPLYTTSHGEGRSRHFNNGFPFSWLVFFISTILLPNVVLFFSNLNPSDTLLLFIRSRQIILTRSPPHTHTHTKVPPPTSSKSSPTSLAVDIKVQVGEGEPIESALRRFKREVNKSGHLMDLRHKRYFENSQDRKKRKIVQARFRIRMERMNARRMKQQRT